MTGGREESSQYTVDSTQGRRRTADNSEFRRARSARVARDQVPVSSSGAGVGAEVGAELVTVQVTDTVMGQVTVAVMLPVTVQVTAQVI